MADLQSLSYVCGGAVLVCIYLTAHITIDSVCVSVILLIISLNSICSYTFPEGAWYVNSASLGLHSREEERAPTCTTQPSNTALVYISPLNNCSASFGMKREQTCGHKQHLLCNFTFILIVFLRLLPAAQI